METSLNLSQSLSKQLSETERLGNTFTWACIFPVYRLKRWGIKTDRMSQRSISVLMLCKALNPETTDGKKKKKKMSVSASLSIFQRGVLSYPFSDRSNRRITASGPSCKWAFMSDVDSVYQISVQNRKKRLEKVGRLEWETLMFCTTYECPLKAVKELYSFPWTQWVHFSLLGEAWQLWNDKGSCRENIDSCVTFAPLKWKAKKRERFHHGL